MSHIDVSSSRHRRRWARRASFVASIALATLVHGESTNTQPSQGMAIGEATAPLAIQVNDDKLTLAVTRAPQIYLYGVIDPDAPERVDALIKSGKIRPSSDIYLNSPGGDLKAGAALGRLFRANKITTHLGVPRRPANAPAVPKASVCQGACAFAYAGGLYRWAPTGDDHFAAQAPGDKDKVAAAADELSAYLWEMNLDPLLFGVRSKAAIDRTAWLSGEQMLAQGIANNGYLPPSATYELVSGAPQLTLRQNAREGERRITLLCKPDGLTLTAYYTLGPDRAQRIAARANRSYFEIDEQPTLQGERERINAVAQSLVISRPVSLTQLDPLVSAHSVGAWLGDKGGAVRYGFTMHLDAVRTNLNEYRSHCVQMAKLSAPTS